MKTTSIYIALAISLLLSTSAISFKLEKFSTIEILKAITEEKGAEDTDFYKFATEALDYYTGKSEKNSNGGIVLIEDISRLAKKFDNLSYEGNYGDLYAFRLLNAFGPQFASDYEKITYEEMDSRVPPPEKIFAQDVKAVLNAPKYDSSLKKIASDLFSLFQKFSDRNPDNQKKQQSKDPQDQNA
ncbi:hypothetical protein [Candidatus Hydrogenosomobacter endosymbioticus]|uniref:Uncharacterized protein n=1 Tax=Candidatus Hydrogenosomobacter endosymbioticus TaxID=2558174 RepID=A0ABM7V842_9PROT|nr:hypothetical protein [Candidatus Hydrogenosomobacter endosymbioticus]BDB95930.1 hypothetical protein HYD_0630 [Candidatus Hydrogenosomobacter endosymbioticus]